MKSIALFLGALLISISANAQEHEFKSDPGTKAFEINIAPFSSSPIRVDRFKIRRFDENNRVTRFGFTINTQVTSPEENVTFNVVEAQFAPGLEKHRDISDRLSVYTGFEGLLGAKFSWVKDKDTDVTVSGAWDDLGTERGYFQFGGNLIVGADYYMAKNLYLGVEFGYGAVLTKFEDIKFNVNGNQVGETVDGGFDISMGTTFNNMFRLGFSF